VAKKLRHRGQIRLNSEVEKVPVRVVSDAAMASGVVADGRLIPLLIVDASTRPDVQDMLKAHRQITPGDVNSVWGMSSDNAQVVELWLMFKRPSRCVVRLQFDIITLGGIVDQIVSTNALYLQTGKKGDRLMETMDADRILVEVPSQAFRSEWDRLLSKTLERDGRKRKGLTKSQAKQYARCVVEDWRRVTAMRIGGE